MAELLLCVCHFWKKTEQVERNFPAIHIVSSHGIKKAPELPKRFTGKQ